MFAVIALKSSFSVLSGSESPIEIRLKDLTLSLLKSLVKVLDITHPLDDWREVHPLCASKYVFVLFIYAFRYSFDSELNNRRS